jgi:hypothetical protein
MHLLRETRPSRAASYGGQRALGVGHWLRVRAGSVKSEREVVSAWSGRAGVKDHLRQVSARSTTVGKDHLEQAWSFRDRMYLFFLNLSLP